MTMVVFDGLNDGIWQNVRFVACFVDYTDHINHLHLLLNVLNKYT